MARRKRAPFNLKRPGDFLDLDVEAETNHYLFLDSLEGIPADDPRLRTTSTHQLVQAGLMIPLPLEAGRMLVRFRLGDPAPHEEAEWVARAEGWLDLSGGLLRYGSIEARLVRVPPGQYRVTVDCHLPHCMGGDFLERAMGRPKKILTWKDLRPEPFRAYWRRTRPGRPVPPWLVTLTADREAEKGDPKQPDETALVEVVVRLTELTGKPPVLRLDRSGYAREASWRPRVPAACPEGIPAARRPDEGRARSP
jgi:hypothetical protein